MGESEENVLGWEFVLKKEWTPTGEGVRPTCSDKDPDRALRGQ